MCPDKINDMLTHCIESKDTFNPVLACQDNCIRVLNEKGVFYTYKTNSGVNCISVINPSDLSKITNKN